MTKSIPYSFPPGFVWGVAAAAAQIEGAATVGGKGESIWDRFASRPGNTRNGHTPAVACDHYRRFDRDFALMHSLGIRHYRLSLAWPRLHPDGGPTVNRKGLDHYRRVFDSMARHGITPWVTLYHWDLPQALEDSGGWRVRGTADAFARYCETAVRAFHGQVKNWITLNEIPTFIDIGYRHGRHAPGARVDDHTINQAFHHTLLAHGRAVHAVREFGGRGARVGLTQDINPVAIPFTETPRDIAAAQQEFSVRNAPILAPIFQGRYPSSYLRRCGKNRPRVERGDLPLIAQPTDFLGLNIYSGSFVRAAGRAYEMLPLPPHYPQAGPDWLKIAPQSIYWALRHSHELYGPRSLYITENGAGYQEPDESGAALNDLHRREYLRNYLLHVHRATRDSIPCRGYFLWSFLDNFEWADGYTMRFGITHVNYATQRRTPKLSARWYSEVIRQNRLV